MTFEEAWQLVKSEAWSQLPEMSLKVHRALKFVKPHLFPWEWRKLYDLLLSGKDEPVFVDVCRGIDDRIKTALKK